MARMLPVKDANSSGSKEHHVDEPDHLSQLSDSSDLDRSYSLGQYDIASYAGSSSGVRLLDPRPSRRSSFMADQKDMLSPALSRSTQARIYIPPSSPSRDSSNERLVSSPSLGSDSPSEMSRRQRRLSWASTRLDRLVKSVSSCVPSETCLK